MLVTVIIVLIVQMRCDDVIGMVAVGHGFVPTTLTVAMSFGMPLAGMRLIAYHWLKFRDGQGVFVNVIAMNIVKVSVMHEVDVIIVADLRVSATLAVPVPVSRMRIVFHGS